MNTKTGLVILVVAAPLLVGCQQRQPSPQQQPVQQPVQQSVEQPVPVLKDFYLESYKNGIFEIRHDGTKFVTECESTTYHYHSTKKSIEKKSCDVLVPFVGKALSEAGSSKIPGKPVVLLNGDRMLVSVDLVENTAEGAKVNVEIWLHVVSAKAGRQ